jgi:hypothetical protein
LQGHRDEERAERALRVVKLLQLLRTRFGELPPAAIARVKGAKIAVLERWAERVRSAQTLAEVLDEPS